MQKILLFLAILLTISLASAQTNYATCSLSASLISQDPYPAIPGEYVKLVFQVDGVSNPNCGDLTFALVEDYPLIFDPGFDGTVTASSGIFVRDYQTFWTIPYKIRIDPGALNGDTDITALLSSSRGNTLHHFNISVEDVRTDFEVSIKDYVEGTNTLTFEILNTGEHDVEALTIEIPRQENIEVKGSSRNIVGSLDSNEDTTFSFEAIPKEGEISLTIIYTDEINERRTIEEKVFFDSNYFTGRARDQQSTSPWFYVIIIILAIGAFIWYRRRKKRKHTS